MPSLRHAALAASPARPRRPVPTPPRAVARRQPRPATPSLPSAVADAAASLRSLLARTGRVGDASDRGLVEDRVAALERAVGGTAPDFDAKLAGRWRLLWTTAPDVAPGIAATEAVAGAVAGLLPTPSFGDIYQQFASPADGRVANIIRLRLPPLLDSVTATVSATYEVRSERRLRLEFRRAAVGGARLSDAGDLLLAPALLPRGTLTLKALQAVRGARIELPLTVELPAALSPLKDALDRARDAAGAEYLICHLDDELLIGRQTVGGGAFIFERVPEREWVGVDSGDGWA